MSWRRSVAVWPLFLLLSACASVATPPRAALPPASAPVTAQPSSGTIWTERAAEYQAIVRQTYLLAGDVVTAGAAGKAAGTWGVVLDADETVISNLQYQLERERAGLRYDSASWTAWTRRRAAVPLPGAQAFLDRVRALGGVIAIVTNRLQSECADTRAVFDAHALRFDLLLCRPDGSPSDKNPRFQSVVAGTAPGARGPVEVLAWLGDNIQDFPGMSQALRQQPAGAYQEFGRRWFVLPNPMYGSWE